MTKKIDVRAAIKNAKLQKVSGGESFRFQSPGDKLVGIYRGMRKGSYDEKEINIFRIENVENKVVEVWESKALEVLRDLKDGAVVSIEYIKTKKGKGGRTFKVFDIQSDSPLNS